VSRIFAYRLFPLYLTILIDAISLGVVFPVMPHLFLDNVSGLFASDVRSQVRVVMLGLALSAFPLAMFFGSTIIGALSDNIGRRRTLILCLLGNAIGFLALSMAVYISSISLFLIGRLISGLSAGSVPVAQASIIDLSSESTKSVRIGFSSVANGLGFAIGPLLGGFFFSTSIIGMTKYFTPFVVCLILSICNAAYLYFRFKETGSLQKHPLSMLTGIKNVLEAFCSSATGHLSIVFVLFVMGYFGLMQYLPIYLATVFNFSSATVASYLSFYALCFVFSLSCLYPFIVKMLKISKLVQVLLLIQPCLAFMFLLKPAGATLWCLIAVMSIPFSFCYVSLTSLFSSAVDAHSQGKIMGVVASLFAISWAIIPFVSGLLQNVNPLAPIMLFVTLLVCSYFFYKKWPCSTG
jgi:MFS transporter, DHA1 family, tetracycline resistance protein